MSSESVVSVSKSSPRMMRWPSPTGTSNSRVSVTGMNTRSVYPSMKSLADSIQSLSRSSSPSPVILRCRLTFSRLTYQR